jgi:hypothetical protein
MNNELYKAYFSNKNLMDLTQKFGKIIKVNDPESMSKYRNLIKQSMKNIYDKNRGIASSGGDPRNLLKKLNVSCIEQLLQMTKQQKAKSGQNKQPGQPGQFQGFDGGNTYGSSNYAAFNTNVRDGDLIGANGMIGDKMMDRSHDATLQIDNKKDLADIYEKKMQERSNQYRIGQNMNDQGNMNPNNMNPNNMNPNNMNQNNMNPKQDKKGNDGGYDFSGFVDGGYGYGTYNMEEVVQEPDLGVVQQENPFGGIPTRGRPKNNQPNQGPNTNQYNAPQYQMNHPNNNQMNHQNNGSNHDILLQTEAQMAQMAQMMQMMETMQYMMSKKIDPKTIKEEEQDDTEIVMKLNKIKKTISQRYNVNHNDLINMSAHDLGLLVDRINKKQEEEDIADEILKKLNNKRQQDSEEEYKKPKKSNNKKKRRSIQSDSEEEQKKNTKKGSSKSSSKGSNNKNSNKNSNKSSSKSKAKSR